MTIINLSYIKLYKTVLFSLFLLFNPVVYAKDKLETFDFYEVIQQGYDEGILDKNIRFKLVGQKHNKVSTIFSEYKSNKKTNGFGKSAKKSCSWALLSALKSFQKRANSLGANAVIDIKSNFKNKEFVSSTEYQCGKGFLMSGVALKANIVNLE